MVSKHILSDAYGADTSFGSEPTVPKNMSAGRSVFTTVHDTKVSIYDASAAPELLFVKVPRGPRIIVCGARGAKASNFQALGAFLPACVSIDLLACSHLLGLLG